jgi:hypothetical protein
VTEREARRMTDERRDKKLGMHHHDAKNADCMNIR